jgi:ribonuclease-3
MTSPKLDLLCHTLHLKFKQPSRLRQSLVHRSYLNENRHSLLSSNERYEFLGDAVLELWISQTLFRLFPQYQEGDLTNLRSLIVCTPNLYRIAKSINLGQYIFLSRGEETHGGRNNPSILADTLESLIGAVYLDSGLSQVDHLLHSLFDQNIADISSQKIYKDPKSLFQEIAQEQKGITPGYQTTFAAGPDHAKTFTVAVSLGDQQIATGTGPSKQKAEEAAAVTAIKLFKIKH